MAHNLDTLKELLEKGDNLSAAFDTVYYHIQTFCEEEQPYLANDSLALPWSHSSNNF